MTEKTECRTPNANGVTRIPSWKFDVVRRAILEAVGQAGREGVAFSDLSSCVADRLSDEDRANLGSLGWHVTTVKLELEVRGELEKFDNKGKQRLIVSKT